MSITKPVQLGFVGRLKAAGALVLRGAVPWDAETLARFFGDGASGASGAGPRKSYSQVGVVYACVRARGEAIAGMPLMISAGDDEVIESGPLAELVEQPNAAMNGRAFWLATSALLDLFGKVHWVLDRDTIGRVAAVYPVAPPQMRALTDRRTGEVTGWKYRPAGRLAGFEETLAPDEVHTIIDPDFEDPHNPLKGLSPRAAVSMAISQYFKSDLANEASLDNGVEPGGALRTQGNKELTETQRRELKQWVADHHSGVRNRRRFMLLEGLEWQQIGAAFKDMEFTELKKMSRADICSAFQVPGPVVSLFEDSNYAHANAAQEQFYTNTILPRAARLADEWEVAVLRPYQGDRSLAMSEARTVKLVRRGLCAHGFLSARRAAARSGRRFYAWFDSSQVAAVQRAALGVAETAMKWHGMGVPLNSILRATDAPFEEVPWGDRGYKPIGLIPYDEDLLDTIDDPPGSPGTPGSEEPALLPDGQEAAGGGRTRRRGTSPADATLKASEATRANLWAQLRKSWEALELQADSRLRRHFHELRREVLANLDRAADQLGPPEPPEAPDVDKGQRAVTPDQQRDLLGTVLFDIEQADGRLQAKVGKLIREGFRLGGEQAMLEAAQASGGGADTADPFNIEDPVVREKLAARDIKLKDVNRTLRRRLSHKLAEAVDDRQTVQQMGDMVRSEFNLAGSRSRTIARTEMHGAVEEARAEGRRQAGVPMKSWLSSRKETGRPSHAATEAETLANPLSNDDDFTIAGTSITCQAPGETGLPEHDINCGCTTLSRYPKDSLKSVLDRYVRNGFLSYEQLVKRDMQQQTRKDATP